MQEWWNLVQIKFGTLRWLIVRHANRLQALHDAVYNTIVYNKCEEKCEWCGSDLWVEKNRVDNLELNKLEQTGLFIIYWVKYSRIYLYFS